mmetsp:Transcript_4023/g.12864  ORF Transcript_4023/g.12864 Transcript_4023/m.12864 type:complete len:137 (-) Transcript_4023:576-986(-)
MTTGRINQVAHTTSATRAPSGTRAHRDGPDPTTPAQPPTPKGRRHAGGAEADRQCFRRSANKRIRFNHTSMVRSSLEGSCKAASHHSKRNNASSHASRLHSIKEQTRRIRLRRRLDSLTTPTHASAGSMRARKRRK